MSEKSMFLKALETSIDEILLTSYHNQYRSQLSSAGFSRADFLISDMKKRKLDRTANDNTSYIYTTHINLDLIHRSKRTKFKRSSFYDDVISLGDIIKNPDIFIRVPILFIEGEVYTAFQVRQFNGYIELSFDDDTLDVDELVKNESKATFLLTPNVSYGTYVLDKDEYEKNRYQLNDALNTLSVDGFIGEDVNAETYALTNLMVHGARNNSPITLDLSSKINRDESQMYLNHVGWKNIVEKFRLPSGESFFRLKYDMPLPKENILLFRMVDGVLKLAHTCKLKQYYPYTYEVVGNEQETDIYIMAFYYEPSIAQTKMVNYLSVYEEYMGTNPLDYGSQHIHELAKEYIPEDYIYNIPNYADSFHNDPTTYKIYKFNDWVQNNSELMRLFLRNQINVGDEYTDSFYLDMSLVDLDEKIRENNHEEVKNGYEHEEFDEPRYMLIIRRDELSPSTPRMYIDGEFYYSDKFWYVGQYEYHYVPARLVTKDSIIEVERFRVGASHHNLIFRRIRDTKMVDFSPNTTRRVDIFMLNVDDDNKFVDRNDYSISLLQKGQWNEIKPGSFDFINGPFRVNLKNEDLLNKNLRIMFIRSSFMIRREVLTNSATETFRFRAKFNDDDRQIRVFRNRRLLSQNLYNIKLTKSFGGVSEVNPGIMKYAGDEYIIDVTPNLYHVVYSQDTIPRHGVLDLRGKVPKPLDLKWYDFYLNGRRLSIKEIEFLSPKIMAIRNVKSLRNFVILERNKERTMVSDSEADKTITETLFDKDQTFYDRVLGKFRDNENTEQDIITEIVSATDLAIHRVLWNILPFIDTVNPDEKQIHSDWEEYAGLLMDDNGNIFMNPDARSKKPSHILLNPDDEIDPEMVGGEIETID